MVGWRTCPSSPNCVCSDCGSKGQRVDAFTLRAKGAEAWGANSGRRRRDAANADHLGERHLPSRRVHDAPEWASSTISSCTSALARGRSRCVPPRASATPIWVPTAPGSSASDGRCATPHSCGDAGSRRQVCPPSPRLQERRSAGARNAGASLGRPSSRAGGDRPARYALATLQAAPMSWSFVLSKSEIAGSVFTKATDVICHRPHASRLRRPGHFQEGPRLSPGRRGRALLELGNVR